MDQDNKNQTNTTTNNELENKVHDINLQNLEEIIAELKQEVEKTAKHLIDERLSGEISSSEEELEGIYQKKIARLKILIEKIEKLHSGVKELVQSLQRRDESYGMVENNIGLIKAKLLRKDVDNDNTKTLEETLKEVNSKCKSGFVWFLENQVIVNNYTEAEKDFKKKLIKTEESYLHGILDDVATYFFKLKHFHCLFVNHMFCNFGKAIHFLKEELKNNKAESKKVEVEMNAITNLSEVIFYLTKTKNEEMQKKINEFVELVNTMD